MVILHHGTTRRRAEAILKNGPDPRFVEPGAIEPAGGFSTAYPTGPYPVGSPTFYALGKARLFPAEGGPAILEIEVPESLAAKGDNTGGEIRFLPGFGLEELLEAWPTLPKRILTP
jgi:hypothetical protein